VGVHYELNEMGRYDRTPMQRFLEHVNKTDTCWLWTGCCHKKGYGQFKINGKTVKAHRWSYEQHKGAIPEGLMMRHKCDVRNCVNPDHLEVGTNTDNMRDMVERGRHVPAMRGVGTLTEDDVREIRKLHVQGLNGVQISMRYPVAFSTIYRILNGQYWAHVQ
jgi:hypothetical protein